MDEWKGWAYVNRVYGVVDWLVIYMSGLVRVCELDEQMGGFVVGGMCDCLIGLVI